MVSKDDKVNKMKKVLVENLNYYLKRKDKTQTDMARELEFPETTVSNWMKGETYPRPDKIQVMADYFGVKRSDLTEEKNPTNIEEIQPNFVKIPIIGEIACGEPLMVQEQAVGYMWELSEGLPHGELFALVAKGDSMEPTIFNGAKVIVRHQEDVENGEIAAVLVNGDTEATLKRVKKQGNLIMLMPDNHKYDPIAVDENNPARIIGKVVRSVRDFI